MFALQFGELHDSREYLAALAAAAPDKTMRVQEVGPEDIAGVVSRWTGVPVTRLGGSEKEKLLRLREELHKRLVGQAEAVQLVADAVMKARSGFSDGGRPSTFLFLGPTGCGKTELAKALAEQMFDDEKFMVGG